MQNYYKKSIYAKKVHKNLHNSKKSSTFAADFEGEMAEWSIAAVLKTVELRGSGGSNPSLSAKKEGVPKGAPFLFL